MNHPSRWFNFVLNGQKQAGKSVNRTSKNEGKMPDTLYHLATSDSKVNQDFIVMILKLNDG